MIINASGGNADAVMTVAQTLSDTQKTQARTNIGALSSASGAVTAANLASNAVTTAKITDSNITRAKLAADALYSPIVSIDATVTITKDYNGKTLRMTNGKADYTINFVKDANIPVAMECGIFRNWAKSNKIVFDSTCRVAFSGESDWLTAPTFTIADTFTMIAVKKISSDSNYDYWLIIGNVEVV